MPVPASGHEVPEEDDRPSVFQNQGVVLSGNRITPPFVVDSPSLSNRHYPESLSLLVELCLQALVVGANPDRERGLQGPQPLSLEAARMPVSGAVCGWSAGIHENRAQDEVPEDKPNTGAMQFRIGTRQRDTRPKRKNLI